MTAIRAVVEDLQTPHTCLVCGVCRPLGAFRINYCYREGRDRLCPECRSARQRRYTDANRERIRAYRRSLRLQDAAVADGKANPAYARKGFALVASRSGFYRAAPTDQPVGKTEEVMARYEPVNGRWSVKPAPVPSPANLDFAVLLAKRELRRLRKAAEQNA